MTGSDFISRSPEETTEKGRELARSLTAPVLVLLSGDLGTGKTTFTKGIIGALGAAEESEVTSPTFTLVHVFQTPANIGEGSAPGSSAFANRRVKVYHVDLYRVEGFNDLATLDLEDALSEPAIVIIEWSERFSLRSDWPRIYITLEHLEGDSRHITISKPVLPEESATLAPPRPMPPS